MKKDLKALTDEQLAKEFKTSRFFFWLFLGFVLIMVIAAIISIAKEKIRAQTYLPIAFLPMVLIYWNNFNKARIEMRTRELK